MPGNDHFNSGAVSGAGQYKSLSMTDKTEEGVILKKEENVIEVMFPYMGYKADESTMENNKADYHTEDQEQSSPVLLDRYILLSTY